MKGRRQRMRRPLRMKEAPVKTKNVPIALAILTLVSLAHAGVKVDYDNGTDFSKYRSFGWMEGTPATRSTSASTRASVRPIARRAIARAVRTTVPPCC